MQVSFPIKVFPLFSPSMCIVFQLKLRDENVFEMCQTLTTYFKRKQTLNIKTNAAEHLHKVSFALTTSRNLETKCISVATSFIKFEEKWTQKQLRWCQISTAKLSECWHKMNFHLKFSSSKLLLCFRLPDELCDVTMTIHLCFVFRRKEIRLLH